MVSGSIQRKEEMLVAARKAVTGDRQLNYGTPEQNFERIAELWNAWFGIQGWHRAGEYVQPWEVSALMVLMKLARLANNPAHKDSWIDIAGYAACGYDITTAADDASPAFVCGFNIEDARICHACSAAWAGPNAERPMKCKHRLNEAKGKAA